MGLGRASLARVAGGGCQRFFLLRLLTVFWMRVSPTRSNSHLVSAFAIVCPSRSGRSSTARATAVSTTTLCMVSRKEKRRFQEGAQKRETLEELRLAQARSQLEVQLRELLHHDKPNVAAGAAHKLLKNAQHDGLEDIGLEARRWLIVLFFKAKQHPSDLVEHLTAVEKAAEDNDDDRHLWGQHGLWAHAELKDWSAAAEYADRLLAAAPAEVDEPPSVSLVLLAIQVYAHTENLQRAADLFRGYALDQAHHDEEERASISNTLSVLLRAQAKSGTSLSCSIISSWTKIRPCWTANRTAWHWTVPRIWAVSN